MHKVPDRRNAVSHVGAAVLALVARSQGISPIAKIAIAISISIFLKIEIVIAISIVI